MSTSRQKKKNRRNYKGEFCFGCGPFNGSRAQIAESRTLMRTVV